MVIEIFFKKTLNPIIFDITQLCAVSNRFVSDTSYREQDNFKNIYHETFLIYF